MSKLKFVLIGCGRIATLHVIGYQNNPDAELYGVYDKNISLAKKFAKEYNIPKVYDSYEEVLADPAVCAVEILVPHHLHCELTVQACEAKKHVSVQKPMALNLCECDKMIEAAKKNGVKLKVFENFVFYPPYQLAKKLLDAGEIGEPAGLRYKMTNCGLNSQNAPAAKLRAKMANVDEKLETTGWKVDVRSLAWRVNESLAGGGPIVFDDGYHKFSTIMYMLGDVEKVNAWIEYTPVLPGVCQDAPAVIMWKHKNKNVFGVFDVTSADEMYINSKYYTCDERLELTGSRGIIWVTRCTATLLPEIAPVVMYRDGKLTEYWDMPCDWADSFEASTKDFIQAIKDNREPVLNGEKGREVLKFALASIDSSKKKCEIYLDSYEDKALLKRRKFFGMFRRS
ncbi:MAG: Gfo/Idh/MocA family oxidoreductase [Clostridia bacterium]|nr:Gfo/Idh/MocA family oxidoreductase [Clostridia bacterium]